jgi:hypothetical protein
MESAWAVLLSGLLGGALGMIGSVIVSRTQSKSDGREEWFRRVQWAQELTASDDEQRRAAGYRVLAQLSQSSLASDDDRELLLQLVDWDRIAALAGKYQEAVDDTDFVGHPAGSTAADEERRPGPDADEPVDQSAGPRQRVYVTPSTIAAARAQVVISRQLGRAVPKVVEKIAQAR